MNHPQRRPLRIQLEHGLAAIRKRLTPEPRLRTEVVPARASWLLLADGRPALRTGRRTH